MLQAIAEPMSENASSFPRMMDQDGVSVPEAPGEVGATGIDRGALGDLALKTANMLPQCSTKWVAGQMRLPMALVEDLMQELRKDQLLEVLGLEGPFNHRYAISGRGMERVKRLLSISGYVGPAPVPLEVYTAMIHRQYRRFHEATISDTRRALEDLVLPPEDVLTAALAATSGRSLLLFGSSGNGKTSVARCLHNALEGELWIPHAVSVGHAVIQVFDPQMHEESDFTLAQAWKADQRWVRIRRPFVVAGGELTSDMLELSYSSSLGFYEAPLHVKANGGTLLIDDLGRQRVEPAVLLNRWILPLEHGFDYLALQAGLKIKVPFQLMLLVATNLDPDKSLDPAFLRRMGYRLHVSSPSPERYQDIFERVAARHQMTIPPGFMQRVFERYQDDGRELRCCEPHDLIGRIRDICRLRRQPAELNDDVLDEAWFSYFGLKRGAD